MNDSSYRPTKAGRLLKQFNGNCKTKGITMSVDFLKSLDSIAEQIGESLGINAETTEYETAEGYKPTHRRRTTIDAAPIGNDFDGVVRVMREGMERGRAKTARMAETRILTDAERARRTVIIERGRALEACRRTDIAHYFEWARKGE